MFAQVLKQRQSRISRVNLDRDDNDDSDVSGRSTPAHLKNININIQSDDDDEAPTKTTKKTRTFSETLKMLDDDILADLDVK